MKILKNESPENYLGLIDLQGKPKSGAEVFQQTSFILDADTNRSAGLETRNFKMIVNLSIPETIELHRIKETKKESVLSFSGKKGINTFKWSLSTEEVNDLIYLRSNYFFQGKNLLTLTGKVVNEDMRPIRLRLK